jgi:toxin FitB
MKLIDTNLIIYAAQPQFRWLLPLIATSDCQFATVTKIEVLGFRTIEPEQIIFFEKYFSMLTPLHLTDAIIEQTIKIRQSKKIKLGDAIIAGTARVHNLEIFTHNVADFINIDGVSVRDPFAQ